jgi:2-methylcitrate dehydratase PrpD
MYETKKIVDFICETKYEDLPEKAVTNAKGRILDIIGVSFMGSQDPVGKVVYDFVGDVPGTPECSVINSGIKTDCLNAAFANGMLMHAIDFDDHYILSHTTMCILPAVLALAERLESSGKDIILALIVGNEVYSKVQKCTTTAPWYTGFHGSGVWGSLGAVAACGKLMGLDKQQMHMAWGIACSTFCGVKRNMGTMTKPYHAGRAAEGGLRAAILAKYGLESHAEAFEGKFGFCQVFSNQIDYKYLDELGKVWDYSELPPWVKPHPSCGGTHAAMNGMLQLIKMHDIQEDDVARVDVGMSQGGIDSLYYSNPKDIYEAKFSMQFVIALLLHKRRWGLKLHTEENVNDPKMRELYKIVNFYLDDELEQELGADYADYLAKVKVEMKDGTVYEIKTPMPSLTLEEIREKFDDCTNGIISKERANAIGDAIADLENMSAIDFMQYLA